MPNDLEHRVTNLEDREAILYGYIDELRSWSKESKERIAFAEDRIRQNEEMIHDIVEMNGNVLRVLDAIEDKMDGMDDRMKASGI
jgi:hypothetical protein